MIGDPVCLAPTGDVCGEGIVWHAAHRAVYWADINRFLIHRLNLADSCVRTWLFEEPVTALSLTDSDDVLAVVLGSRVILWEPSTEVRRDSLFHLDGWPTVRLNDARSDPRGSLWVGSMRNNVNADGSARLSRRCKSCAAPRIDYAASIHASPRLFLWARRDHISALFRGSGVSRRFTAIPSLAPGNIARSNLEQHSFNFFENGFVVFCG